MSMDKRLELSRANISPESADLRDERTVLLPLELVQLSLIILSGKPFGSGRALPSVSHACRGKCAVENR